MAHNNLVPGPALQSVLDNVDTIISSLEEYSDNSCGEAASKAHGFASISDDNFVISSKIAIAVLSMMENLNAAVQWKRSSLSGMSEATKIFRSYLQNLRNDDHFKRLHEDISL